MRYKAFDRQAAFHKSPKRIRAVFSGKRGGKTEAGAIEVVRHLENQIGHNPKSLDPYLVVIVAPTHDMLKRLSLEKLMIYAKPFEFTFIKNPIEIRWHNGSRLYGISGDKPQRLEGLKANAIWIDEVFQVTESLYLEALARIADTKGRLWVTGSLGVQYINPKRHWVHRHFKENAESDTDVFEWATADNPYFPKDELTRLRDTLDPKTYRQMFELSWETDNRAAVYDTFTDANVINDYTYNPNWPTYVSIDWGYAHEMACLYAQHDPISDVVYIFDEIVSSRMTLDHLWDRMKAKPYRINKYFCDAAGKQTREQTGISNVDWFMKSPRNIHFQYRSTAVTYGIPLVRSYIQNGRGQRKLFISSRAAPKTLDSIQGYAYKIKDGIINSEIPEEKNDDPADALRYLFVNQFDFTRTGEQFENFSRWNLESRMNQDAFIR